MPKGNRVETLEEEVAELKATVNGLTEELVTLQDRVRELEGDSAEAEVTEQTILAEATPEDIEAAAAEAAKGGEPDHSDDDAGEGESTDDIIVA